MNRVLNKRLLRDLKSNFARYLALFLLIAFGMYIIIAIVGAAETIITGTARRAEENKVEDGQFSVFIALAEEQENELRDTGITLERMFSVDAGMEDESVLRVFRNRENINLIDVDEGRLAGKTGEAVLEKRYAGEHEIAVGDSITVRGEELTVTGIGSVPEYDMPIGDFSDTAVESTLFGLVFVTAEQYEEIKTAEDGIVEEYCYAYRLNGKLTHDELKEKIKELEFDYNDVKDEYFRELISDTIGRKEEIQEGISTLKNGTENLVDGLKSAGITEGAVYFGALEISDGVSELKTETEELLDEFFTADIDNLTSFIKAEDNPRICAAAGDQQMNKSVGLIAGVIVMVLFTYVISVFVIHQIQRESSVIGALYALGVKKKNLIAHYIALPTIISLMSGLTGSAIGFSNLGIVWQMRDVYNYYSVPDMEPVYPLYLIIYAVIMPPVISAIVNFVVINKRLSRTALSLIRNEQKIDSRSRLDLGKMGFIRRFQIRQMLRETRASLTVVFGMIISLLIFMLGLNCYVLCDNIRSENAADTKYEYMYTLKYPEKTPPENAEACYTESLSKTEMGYTLDVSVIGIDEDNKYYGVTPEKGKSSIFASSSAAQKYSLDIGDKLILTDSANDMDYAFTVKGIADYSVGLSVFMDIDSMRELFSQEDDYYNMLLSDEALEIDEGRVYSVTEKSDIERSSAVFVELMKPMFTMMMTVSIVIFCVVMYLMMNVMIDRASFGISLIKIFGFRTNEIRKLYLNGNTVIVAAGAVISMPLAKFIMDSIYPYFIANTACGMNLTFPWYLYAAIFAGIMLIYFITNSLLVHKLKKISPAEVLKNRE